MARIRTLQFLPEIFKTSTNAQFLGATLDNLVNNPSTTQMQGYVGSKFGYGVNAKDYYVTEPNATRTDYQLAPGVAFLNENMSLLRGDTRTDNMLFTAEGLVMVDFGSFSSGRPSCDVANLLSSCIEPGPNSLNTYQQLSDFYYDSLISNGVTDYSKAQHENDMQVCLALQAYLLVLAAAHYEADYGESSLVKIWSERLTNLVPLTSPLLDQVATV